MVVDIQGVDDLYTDPAIHSISQEFGESDLGVRGMAMFFHSYKYNPVSRYLCLPEMEDPEIRHIRAESRFIRQNVDFEPIEWEVAPTPRFRGLEKMIVKPLPEAEGTSGLFEVADDRGTGSNDMLLRTKTGINRTTTAPIAGSPRVSPRVEVDDDGKVTFSAATELATPAGLALTSAATKSKALILAEVYGSLADLYDQVLSFSTSTSLATLDPLTSLFNL